MDVRGCEKNMDARARGSLQRLPGAVNVAGTGTSQASDDGTPQRCGDTLHGFEVAVGGDGESGLDHVHAEAVELLGQAQLFLHIHAAARRLLAVTKRGVEDGDARPIHRSGTSRKIACLVYRRVGAQEKIIMFTAALVEVIVLEVLMLSAI